MNSANPSDSQTTPIDTCPVCAGQTLHPFYTYASSTYQRCATCGLLFIDPQPSEAAMIARAEHWAQSYHKTPQKVEQHYTRAFQETAFGEHLRFLAAFRQNNQLLDLGCGIGGFLSAAQAAGWQATGVDVSSSVQVAQAHGLRAIQAALDDAGLEAGSFDVITLFDVIEHLPKADKVLSEVLRLLRPGGCLYILTPNEGGLSARLLKERWEAAEPADHVILYTRANLSRLLARHGFTNLRGWAIDLNFFALLDNPRGAAQPQRDESERIDKQKTRRKFIKRIVQSPFLRALRNLVNLAFKNLLLGDKLIVVAVKPEK
jgi:2-polyprenyl-3-methyl-5-hydroxy-6-metoxy-1,4-benzoquinol methylase